MASALLFALALPVLSEAQSRDRRDRRDRVTYGQSNTEGFILGGGLEATTHDPRRGRELAGPGLGLTFGYGITENIAILGNLGGASLEDDFTLTHADALLRITLRDGRSRVRPYFTGGVTRRVLSQNKYDGYDNDIFDDWFDSDSTERETNGNAVTLGFGLSIFVTRELGIDVGLLGSGGEYREQLVDGNVVSRRRERAGSGRLRVGVTWFPGK